MIERKGWWSEPPRIRRVWFWQAWAAMRRGDRCCVTTEAGLFGWIRPQLVDWPQ